MAISHGAEARESACEGQLHLRLAILNAVQPRPALSVVTRVEEARLLAFRQFGDSAVFDTAAPSLRLPSVQTNTALPSLQRGKKI